MFGECRSERSERRPRPPTEHAGHKLAVWARASVDHREREEGEGLGGHPSTSETR